MNEEQAIKAVQEQTQVQANTGQGDVHAVGRAVAYTGKPMILLETISGERVWWRADMVSTA